MKPWDGSRTNFSMSKKGKLERFSKGTLIGNYLIEDFIGQGSYGDIYSCLDRQENSRWAIKFECTSVKKPHLEKERDFMLKLGESKYFPIYHDFGENENYRWLVMELLGPSLVDNRFFPRGSRYSLASTILIGYMMLKGIESFHRRGILHRDIKPGNFLFRPSKKYPLVLIDYGLSRPFLDEHNNPIPPRDKPGFVGTSPYASLNAHNGVELGRRDDLFSWFFVLIKLHMGDLPWSGNKTKAEVCSEKINTDIPYLIRKLPHQYVSIYQYICSLEQEQEPNYKLIYSLLIDGFIQNNGVIENIYEWIENGYLKCDNISNLPFVNDGYPSFPSEIDSRNLESTEIVRAEKTCGMCLIL